MKRSISFCIIFFVFLILSLVCFYDPSLADESIITYGNYGYKNYTGGREPTGYFPTDFSKPAIDSLDELFKKHDQVYWAADEMGGEKGKRFRREGDCELLKGLHQLKRIGPSKWDRPPQNPSYAITYINQAIKVFTAMCALRSRGEQ